MSNTTAYTFLSVFSVKEVRSVLTYTLLMVLATSILFNDPLFEENFRRNFLLGGMAGFFSIGFYTDFLGKGKHLYTCIITLHVFSLALLVINIIFRLATGRNLFMGG